MYKLYNKYGTPLIPGDWLRTRTGVYYRLTGLFPPCSENSTGRVAAYTSKEANSVRALDPSVFDTTYAPEFFECTFKLTVQ
jgi:hypothetical protein